MRLKIFIFLLLTFSISDVYDGYTLYTPGGGFGGGNATTYLKNSNWETINSWTHNCGPASMPYLVLTDEPGIENSLLYYPCQNNNPIMETGGTGGQVNIYNWDGDLLWNFVVSGTINGATSNNEMQHHHDIEPLPNGNVLVIAWERLYSSEWQALGVDGVNNNFNQMWTTAILEVEPNFQTGGYEIVWEWYIKDHLVQDINPNLSNYGVISEHPELMDANCGNIGSSGPGGQANGDWMHINAIDYNEDLDQIVLSSRFQDEIYIIDHSTTTQEAASHSGGNSGKGGDFLYRWGNPQNYGRGNNSDHWLGDQHSINWIDEGSPGQGNLICYVNRFTDSYAAVLEFIPPLLEDGNYYIEDGQPYGPSSYEWLKQASSNFNFTTSMQGGAFRLPNGNTIITDCDSADIYEIDSNGFLEDSFSESGGNIMIARAEKYNPDYFNFVAGIPGDVNGDEIINILDVVQTINIILGSQESTSLADLNDDGIVNILDVVQLINIVLNP